MFPAEAVAMNSENVKQDVITRNWTYELPRELLNNLGLMTLENEERLRLFTRVDLLDWFTSWLLDWFNDFWTRLFELVTYIFELVTRKFELATLEFELMDLNA